MPFLGGIGGGTLVSSISSAECLAVLSVEYLRTSLHLPLTNL